MARVDVKPDVLLWALRRTGKMEIVQKKFPILIKWINNESQPTFKQLEKFAKATSIPLGYFFLSKPPEEQLPIPHFRTLGDQNNTQPSPDLLETVQTMERRQGWMRDYLIELGQEPLPFVGSATLADDPKHVARNMRSTLGLVNGWAAECQTWEQALRMLIEKVAKAGIIVVVNGIVGNNTHRKLDVNEFRGFVLVDNYVPLIFVNGADGKAAQMFTLAHELAHIWFGASAAFDLQRLHPSDNEIEQACNQAAAEFLVPEEELLKIWPRIRRESDRFQQIARSFKVSELVAARRALDLKLITKNEFFEFYQTRLEKEHLEVAKERNGGNFYATQNFRIGSRFAEAVIRATKEGKLLYHEAYRLTGLNGKTFEKFAERLGLGIDS
jgi:Zn-dependent peptidase ImmA (M78 family)/transcriptional regulator with XRE-family HTH domain